MTLSRYFRRSTLVLATALSLLFACDGNDYDGVTITFYPTLVGQIAEPANGRNAEPTTITLRTSRVLWEDSQVNIRIEGNGAGYGYSYTTEPAMLEPGVITLTIPAGESSASFTFTPLHDGIFEPFDYEYAFRIDQTSKLIESVGQATFSMKVTDSTDPFITFDFEDCSTTPVGFMEQVATGDGVMTAAAWGCSAFGYDGSAGSAEANAYGGGNGSSNSYLILPVINGDQYSTLYVSMFVESYYTGAGTLSVKYSNTYSGTGSPEAEGVTWTELKALNDELPAIGSRKWVQVDGLIENVSGEKFYIAIQYKGAQSASASSWQIDDLEIKGN